MPEPTPVAAETVSAAILDDLDDPRPVFEGDWAKATGHERQAHMTRVAAWKARQPEASGPSAKAKGHGRSGGAQSRTAKPSGRDAPHGHDRDADDLATLDAIIASSKSLASDRIRAVDSKQRILNRLEAERVTHEHGELLALRDALSLVPEGQRAEALRDLVEVV